MLTYLADHCIDIVRQTVTCKADTTLITFQHEGLFDTDPDFEATHACVNFEAVHDWAKAREVNMTRELEEHPEAFERHLWKDIVDLIQEDPRNATDRTEP